MYQTFVIWSWGISDIPSSGRLRKAVYRWRELRVLNFSWSFCLFPLNKSRKQNTETRQARPQLHFALKIIKNRLLVLENELVEVCTISKKCEKNIRSSCVYCSFKGRLSEMPMNAYMKIWLTRNHFVSFLELACKLQPTRSPKLPNWFWWFLVQNEAGVLLVSLLCFVYYFV